MYQIFILLDLNGISLLPSFMQNAIEPDPPLDISFV